MPIFTATATAIVGLTGLTGLAASIATHVIAIGLTIGTNQLLGLDEVEAATVADDGVDVRLGANTQNRLPILYGNFQSRGIVCYYTLSENKQSLTTVLALGEGPITSIDEILWEDYTLTLDANGITTNATRLVGTETETTSKYNGKITVQLYPTGGRSTYLEALTSDWTSAHVMSDIAYVIVSIDYDRDAGIVGLGDMRFRGTGAVDNPGTAVRNLLQNTTYGLGLPDSSIDITSFTTAIAYFNEQVSFNSDTETQKRSRVNGVLNTGDSISRRIAAILEGCNSSLQWYNGQWGLFIDKQDSATSFTFDENNIIGTLSVVETGLENLYNRVVVEYGRGEENNYQRATIELSSPDSVRYPNEIDRTLNLSLPLINNSTEASAVATVILNKGRQQLTASHRADVSAMPLEPGDVVRYNDEDYGWSNKLFRVISVSERYEEGALSYEIQSVEYADAVYDYGVLNAHDVSPNAEIVVIDDIAAVNDLAATGLFPNRAVPAIQLSWTVPSNSLIEAFDIFYSVGGTQFNSSTTLFIKSSIPTVGNFVDGATITEEVTGVPSGNITFWVVGRNDFARSLESNAVTVANYQPNATINAETVYRFNETPSVIDGVNIDVGEPPANATGTGTGRNNNVNDTGWYESELDAANRENAPVWTALTTITRADAQPRELDFLFTGTSGDTITTQTPTNQIIDFELAGTIGDNELQYAARPEITQFTLAGQAAEADSVDPGLAEVWQIDVTGATVAPVLGNSEEFYILPAGVSNTQTAEIFTFTPNGDTSDGSPPENTDASSSVLVPYKEGEGNAATGWRTRIPGGDFISSLDNNSPVRDIVLDRANENDYQDIISFFNITSVFSDLPSGTVLNFTNPNGAVFRVTDPMEIRSFFNGSLQIQRQDQGAFTDFTVTPAPGNTSITDADIDFTLDFNSLGTLIQSSVSLTIDSTSNTYTLANNLSGGVAIGTALNTAIGTDFTGFTKTFDGTTGAITLTADDFANHTGSSSVVQGTNGTITIVDTNVNRTPLTTVRLIVSELPLNQVIVLEPNVTGQDLFDDIETKLLANTSITNQFTVSQDTATIDENEVTVIKLVAISVQNLSLALIINSGITGTTSGTLVEGAASNTATSITITYDPDILPITQMLTFGENATSSNIATELTALIDSHGDLEATQTDSITVIETPDADDPFGDLFSSSTMLGYFFDTTPNSFYQWGATTSSGTNVSNVTEIQVNNIHPIEVGDFILLYFDVNNYHWFDVTAINTLTNYTGCTVEYDSSSSKGDPTRNRNNVVPFTVDEKTLPSFMSEGLFDGSILISNTGDSSPDGTFEIYFTTTNFATTAILVDDSLNVDAGDIMTVLISNTSWAVFEVVSEVDAGTYRQVTVSPIKFTGSPPVRTTGVRIPFWPGVSASTTITLDVATSTDFGDTDLTSSTIFLKPDITGDQTQPVITINTQGTGDAAFAVSTFLDGREAVAGSPALTSYSIAYAGIELEAGNFASGLTNIESARIINDVIESLDQFTSARSSAIVTATSVASSGDDLVITIFPGVNGDGASSTNNLSISRAITQIGTNVDIFAGEDATVTVRVSGEVYFTATYNAESDTIPIILAALEIGIDADIPGFDLNERWDGDVLDDSTIRATALGTGTDPTITIAIAAGSTAVSDAIGNITVTPATLSSTRTVINVGEQTDIVSGELSTFTVTQDTDILISAMSITGNSSATSTADQIASAISMNMDSEYTTSASGPNLLATLVENNSTPDLTIAVLAGLNTDNTAADLAVSRTINQIGSIGTLDLTGATWTYFISSPTTDGDTTMITPDGTIAVRRGLFLNSLAASRDGLSTDNTQVIFGNDLYTTATQASIFDLTGVLHFYVGITAASDDVPIQVYATMQYTTDTTDLPNATWTDITGAISNNAFAQVSSADARVGAEQYISISFASDNFADLASNTEYAFRVLLQGNRNNVIVAVPSNVVNQLAATFQLQEILTTT